MTSADDYLPSRLNLTSLARAAETCRGCDLYKQATQTVFGRGPRSAQLILVGETPGDEEDKLGEPFVGPAGRLLDEAIETAGLDRDEVYVTNVVKHFRWEPRGKRRLHKKPTTRQIEACKPWLHAEIAVVEPKGIVCLGATAAQAMLGRDFRVTKHRGEIYPSEQKTWMMATYHPSAVLRAPDADARKKMLAELTADLHRAAVRIRRSGARR